MEFKERVSREWQPSGPEKLVTTAHPAPRVLVPKVQEAGATAPVPSPGPPPLHPNHLQLSHASLLQSAVLISLAVHTQEVFLVVELKFFPLQMDGGRGQNWLWKGRATSHEEKMVGGSGGREPGLEAM